MSVFIAPQLRNRHTVRNSGDYLLLGDFLLRFPSGDGEADLCVPVGEVRFMGLEAMCVPFFGGLPIRFPEALMRGSFAGGLKKENPMRWN